MNHLFDSNNPWTNNARGLGFNGYSDPYSQTIPYNSAMNMNYQRPSIPGRLVNNLDEITPQEVPMDGSVSLFPQNDYSAIYAKTWTKDGTIATVKYIPEQPQAATPQKSPIEERLDKIDQRFDRLEKILSDRHKPRKPYNKPRQAKEDQTNV